MISMIDVFNHAMMDSGYQPRGEYGILGRRFFTKNTAGSRTHHIHIYQVEHQEIARHLRFRDYLRTHPEDSLAYSQLKKALVEKFCNDPICAWLCGISPRICSHPQPSLAT